MTNEADLYAVLGVSRSAKETEIRRAYRNLVTKEHPDKGGDAARFTAVQRAYDVLSVESKRKRYDATGVAERSPDEELLDAFAGGACVGASATCQRARSVRGRAAGVGWAAARAVLRRTSRLPASVASPSLPLPPAALRLHAARETI